MVTIKLTKDQLDTYQSYARVIKDLSEDGNVITIDQQRRIFERADQLEHFFKQQDPTARFLENEKK